MARRNADEKQEQGKKKKSPATTVPEESTTARMTQKEKEKKKKGSMVGLVVMVTALVTAGVAVAVGIGMQQNPKVKAAVVEFFPEKLVFWVEDQTGWSLSARGRVVDDVPRVPQDTKPDKDFSFSVHFNGDGVSEGTLVSTKDFAGLDEMIKKLCRKMEEVEEIIDEYEELEGDFCDPSKGARLFTQTGKRAFSFLDIPENSRVYIVPRGLHFVWPLGKVGDYLYPSQVESPIPNKPIRLKQLSMSPRVFTVENFMSQEEMDAILNHNKDLVKPSEVGFSGWRDSTRTSSTAWDFHSWAAKKVQRRSFDLLGIEFNKDMADATQVLRYNISEWYKPHTDWFDEKAYDGHDPSEFDVNGTNRFATVFLYLQTPGKGGETVFPLSTTHEGYNGEQLVHKGTDATPGYIAQKDAEWCCNTSSTALRSEPKAGSAVLFYSQGPDGSLDKYSLHGGCPVIEEPMKWSANVWVWNRPKPGKDKAKDSKGDEGGDDSISMQIKNARSKDIDLYWDDGTEEMVFQVSIKPGYHSPMTTYHGHRFVAKEDGVVVHDYRAHDDWKGKEHIEVVN